MTLSVALNVIFIGYIVIRLAVWLDAWWDRRQDHLAALVRHKAMQGDHRNPVYGLRSRAH